MFDAIEAAAGLLLIVGITLAALGLAVWRGWVWLGEYLSDLDGLFTT